MHRFTPVFPLDNMHRSPLRIRAYFVLQWLACRSCLEPRLFPPTFGEWMRRAEIVYREGLVGARDDDRGVTAVLGAILLMVPMAMLALAFLQFSNAQSDLLSAEAERAEQAAWCVRHLEVGPPTCPDPWEGWTCTDEEHLIVCMKPRTRDNPSDPAEAASETTDDDAKEE